MVLSTRNDHKVREFAALLNGIRVDPLPDDVELPPETGETFAENALIKARAAALRRFASIVSGAWEYIVHGHEDEAVQAIIAQRPQAKLDPKVLRGQIEQLKSYFGTEASQGMPLGMMAEADWAQGVKTMASVNLIKPASASEFYTNDLLDRALMRKTAGQ